MEKPKGAPRFDEVMALCLDLLPTPSKKMKTEFDEPITVLEKWQKENKSKGKMDKESGKE